VAVPVALYCMILLTVNYAVVQALSWEFRRADRGLLYDVCKCSEVRSVADAVRYNIIRFVLKGNLSQKY